MTQPQSITQTPTNSAEQNPWYILGAGAVGGLWASQLTRWQCRPTLLAKDEPHQQQLLKGLHIESGNQSVHYQWPALAPPSLTQSTASALSPKLHIKHLLICTKSYQTIDALNTWLPYVHPHATIILVQNGMGNSQLIQSLLPESHIIGGVTTDGIWRKSTNQLVLAGQGSTQLGTLSNHVGTTKPPLHIQHWLQQSQVHPEHLQLEWQANIITSIWHKLAVNSAINGLTALYGIKNGVLATHPIGKARMAQLCLETEDVMSRCHIPPIPHGLMALCLRVLAQTAENKSSMLQDIEAKRTTEIDAINGYIVRQGTHLNLTCSVHRQLIDEVMAL